MKKLITLIPIILLYLNSFSQDKIISLDTVIEAPNTSKEVLYDRMYNHLTRNLVTKKQEEYVFKVEDKEGGRLKVYKTFYYKSKGYIGSNLVNDDVTYDYEILFKDNKIRLLISGFYHPYLGVATTEKPYPAEARPKGVSKKWFESRYTDFVDDTYNVITDIIKNAKTAINTENDLDDW